MDGGTAQLERVLAQIADAADREWLLAQLEPAWRRRARRLDARDELVRQLAVENFGGRVSARMMIGMIARMLDRYAASAYRFERDGGPPADLTRRRLWTILQLNGGRSLSPSSICDVLAGVRGGQKTAKAFVQPHR